MHHGGCPAAAPVPAPHAKSTVCNLKGEQLERFNSFAHPCCCLNCISVCTHPAQNEKYIPPSIPQALCPFDVDVAFNYAQCTVKMLKNANYALQNATHAKFVAHNLCRTWRISIRCHLALTGSSCVPLAPCCMFCC